MDLLISRIVKPLIQAGTSCRVSLFGILAGFPIPAPFAVPLLPTGTPGAFYLPLPGAVFPAYPVHVTNAVHANNLLASTQLVEVPADVWFTPVRARTPWCYQAFHPGQVDPTASLFCPNMSTEYQDNILATIIQGLPGSGKTSFLALLRLIFLLRTSTLYSGRGLIHQDGDAAAGAGVVLINYPWNLQPKAFSVQYHVQRTRPLTHEGVFCQKTDAFEPSTLRSNSLSNAGLGPALWSF
ncbi:hypothetical protein BDV23DRAFT_180363 [Aspergillus alliaceus]|uniref:Uncharacterized protein n=1 Tax=Petromyces alliaceus TaxID=209559 RepID=A0A5N7CHE6_PETAA|nr:hypothetical protein BDV23DRAFT_180363 [Aspergillus alliaceus]